MSASLYQEFGGRGEAEGESGGDGVTAFDEERFGLGVAVADVEAGAGGEVGVVGELEELRFLVEDAGDFDGGVEGAGDQGERIAGGEVTGGGGDGVAVGVGGGVSEEGIHAVEDLFGDDVFEFLGLFVDFGPVEAEVADEEEFDEAMAAEDVEGELVAGIGELDP